MYTHHNDYGITGLIAFVISLWDVVHPILQALLLIGGCVQVYYSIYKNYKRWKTEKQQKK